MGTTMRFGSVCSGIEAASVAWEPLGFRAAWLSEIEPFPSAVLAHHYPSVPNRGDMTKFAEWPTDAIDLLVGGTPCQSFSVAGLRAGLADPRGNLMLTYLAIAAKLRPRWLVWENVPGVLSSNGGRDFGTFLRGLGELGYGFAYRVLDAQFCRAHGLPNAVPQRRRRVFVVGHSGDWRRAAAVLFDGTSLRGNSPPSRQQGQGTAVDVVSSLTASGRGVERTGETRGQDPVIAEMVADTLAVGANQTTGFPSPSIVASTGDIAHCLNAGAMGRTDYETETMIAHALRAGGFDASEDGTGRGTPIFAFMSNASGSHFTASEDFTPTQRIGGDGGNAMAIAYNITPSNSNKDYNAREARYAQALTAEGGSPSARGGDLIQRGWAVRRLTPTECERLQGFPDGYTAVPYRNKPAADGPRYKALGNSMAVNVMRVLGERIALVDAMQTERAAA